MVIVAHDIEDFLASLTHHALTATRIPGPVGRFLFLRSLLFANNIRATQTYHLIRGHRYGDCLRLT